MGAVGELAQRRLRTISERPLVPKQWVVEPPDDEPTPPAATGPPMTMRTE